MAAVNSGPNRTLLVALRDVLEEFGRGTMTVEEVQCALEQTRPLLERDGTDVARAIDLVPEPKCLRHVIAARHDFGTLVERFESDDAVMTRTTQVVGRPLLVGASSRRPG